MNKLSERLEVTEVLGMAADIKLPFIINKQQLIDAVKALEEKADKYDKLLFNLESIIQKALMKELHASGLSDKAFNWDMLVRLPHQTTIGHLSGHTQPEWYIRNDYMLDDIENPTKEDVEKYVSSGNTPQEALHKYWESKK